MEGSGTESLLAKGHHLPGVPAYSGGSRQKAQAALASRCPEKHGGWNRRPPGDRGTAATHIGVPVSKDLVEDVAELPAEDGAAGKWQADGVGPEGEGPLFVVSAQNDAYQGQGQAQEADAAWGRSGGPQPTAAALLLPTPFSLHTGHIHQEEPWFSAKGKTTGKVMALGSKRTDGVLKMGRGV